MFHRVLSLVTVLTISLSGAVSAASGAGVLPFFDDGTALLGKEVRPARNGRPAFTTWSDFGGKQDRNETLAQTALREFKEETAHQTFSKVTLSMVQKSPYVDFDNPHTGNLYRMYLVEIPGVKPDISTFHKNAKKNPNHVEKIEWKYVSANQLSQNAWGWPAKVPGLNETLYGPFAACLKKPTAQAVLSNWKAKVAPVVANITTPKKPTAPAKVAPAPAPKISAAPAKVAPAAAPHKASPKRALKKGLVKAVAKKHARKPVAAKKAPAKKRASKPTAKKKLHKPIAKKHARKPVAAKKAPAKKSFRKAAPRKSTTRRGAFHNKKPVKVLAKKRHKAPRRIRH